MFEIQIKPASLSDVNLIAVLGATTFYEAYFEFDEPPDLANYIAEAFSLSRIAAEFADPNSTFFVAYVNGKAVGYAKLRENSQVDCLKSKNAIELQRIYILHKVYQTGVGLSLLQECVAESKRKGYEIIWLGVWEKNLRAQKFYVKHGFRTVGEISFPYGSTVGTNLVMEKEL